MPPENKETEKFGTQKKRKTFFQHAGTLVRGFSHCLQFQSIDGAGRLVGHNPAFILKQNAGRWQGRAHFRPVGRDKPLCGIFPPYIDHRKWIGPERTLFAEPSLAEFYGHGRKRAASRPWPQAKEDAVPHSARPDRLRQ